MSYAGHVKDLWRGRKADVGETFGLYHHSDTIASANDLDLSNTLGNVFTISGTATINGIKISGVTDITGQGRVVLVLLFTGAAIVANGASPGTGYKAIKTAAAADTTMAAGQAMLLVYDGTEFHEAGTTISGYLGGVTPGTVTASKAVVVDANKDIGDFRNLDATNFDAGLSGTAGSVDVFPGTAASGKLSITAANSAGDTTTTIVNASQSGARTYTIPDGGQLTGAFLLNEGTVVVNESQSASADFRVEAAGEGNFLRVDANGLTGQGQFSIGGAPPTNPQALFAVLPQGALSTITSNQSYFHAQLLPNTGTVIPAGTAPVAASMNIHEPNLTATGTITDAATLRIVDAPTEGTNNYAVWVDSGQIREDAVTHLYGGIPGAATSQTTLYGKKTGISDNTATDIITVTVPNVNAACAIKLDLVASLGTGSDTFESTRYAEGCIVIARQTGANVVPVAATLALATIATVSGGGTLTLAYAVSAVSGAVGATNTFTITVTLVKTGTITDLQCMYTARVINAETGGVTIAAA